MKLFGSKCKKLIHYESREIAGEGEVPGYFIGRFKTNVKLKLQPTTIATKLDDFQYQCCLDAEKIKKVDPKKSEEFEDKRNIARDLLTGLEVIVDINKNDSEVLEKEITEQWTKVKDFFSWSYEDKKLEREFHRAKIKKELEIEQEAQLIGEKKHV